MSMAGTRGTVREGVNSHAPSLQVSDSWEKGEERRRMQEFD
jgi:hypothetical protein